MDNIIYIDFDISDQTLLKRYDAPKIRAGTTGPYVARLHFDEAWETMTGIRIVFFRDGKFFFGDLVSTDEKNCYRCNIELSLIRRTGQFALGVYAGDQRVTNLE